ncbi:MAG: DUF362 domain-containing protein [Nitrospiraceae bacterium]|nr:MAG: DUF362 domain-containing protein [Nitrospiraceae bacterium]
MSTVIIRKASYDYKALRPVVFEILNSTCGDMVREKKRVIIKPNLLAAATPDKAIVTHPMIIKAAAEYVLEKGAVPQISDSPAVGSFHKILKESGITDALAGLNVIYKEFRESAVIDVGEPFRKIDIAGDAVNCDVLINLAKLKTHTQMMLTLGVKNLFGCIVGMKKPEWHFRTGVDREKFAALLVKNFQAIKPSVTIIDGILAMEGEGPGRSGTPRELGVILGSNDAVAADITVCRMIGVEPDMLLTNRFARKAGLSDGEIIIDGDLPAIRDFRLPEITPLVFGPKRFHGYFRRHLVQRPVCNDSECRLCGECWKYCPAKAISPAKKKIRFDYDKCIRCYCCAEVCPHGALGARETFTGRIARRVMGMR